MTKVLLRPRVGLVSLSIVLIVVMMAGALGLNTKSSQLPPVAYKDNKIEASGKLSSNSRQSKPVHSSKHTTLSTAPGWQLSAEQGIKKSEYSASAQIKDAQGKDLPENTWHFANRAQNIRSYINTDGWTIYPRINSDKTGDWNWNYNLTDLSRGANTHGFPNPKSSDVSEKDNTVSIDRGNTIEWYKNSEAGTEQGFTIKDKLDGEGNLALNAKISTNLKATADDKDQIIFGNDKEAKILSLSKLKVTDANNRTLTSTFDYQEETNTLSISIDDSDALYPLTIDPLANSPSWVAEGNQASAYFGSSVASAGDVNGDGYDDVIVGAYYYDNGQADEGAVFVYYGSASGPSLVADWMVESNQANARFGLSVASAGDVNNDGYDDVIIGAYMYDNGQTDEGRAFAYYGSASGLSLTADWTAESNQANAYFGVSVASAGDVNNDGYDDVIVGAYGYTNGQTSEGRAFVYHGSASGLSASPNWSAESNQANAFFGYSVAGSGDVNGDGYGDVVIGAYLYTNGQASEGRVFVYHGSASGLSASPNWTVESNQANSRFGVSVDGAGDVNGDGYDDVIIGAYMYDNGQTDEGAAFVYYGSASGLSASADWIAESDQASAFFGRSVASAGDINNDGYSEVIIGAYMYDNGQVDEGRAFVYHGSASGLSASADWTAESDQAGAWFGISLASAGDVNGDGNDDVIIGARQYDNGQVDEGKAYVYYGSNEAPVITSNGGGATASVNADENQTAVTTVTSTDVDGGIPTYSLTGGADQAKFSINSSTGVLTFNTAPDFETPTDADTNNIYEVTVQVGDGNGGTDTQAISVMVQDINESPVISGTPAVIGNEGSNYSFVPTATDPDGDTLTFSIANKPVWASFSASTGELSGTPGINDANTYSNIIIDVDDGNGGTASLTPFAITINNTMTEVNILNSGTAIVTTPNDTNITCSNGTSEDLLGSQDPGFTYPLGLVYYCFTTSTANNIVTIDFITNLTPDQVVARKYNPSTHTYSDIAGATITEITINSQHALRLTYEIVDNGPLDFDPTVGSIHDPVGLAVANTTPAVSASGLPMTNLWPYILAILAGLGLLGGAVTFYYRKRG